MKELNKFSKNQKAYKEVFNTPTGEKVLADLALFCGQYSPTYRQGDSHETAYREGMRRVFLRIQSFLQRDEEELTKIIQNFRKGEY